MSDNRTPKTDDIAEHLRALDDVKQTATKVKAKLEGLHDEIGRLQLALEGERNTHDKTKAELDKTKQELSEARDKATNWQKRLREAEAKIDSAPKTVAEQWLEELGKSQLIGGLDRVIRGEAESNPADFRKRLVNWFGRRVNTKPEEVIAVGRQLVEKDSKSAAQIEWSPDTPFRDDVDAVEVEITYAGLRFGDQVIEKARGNVVEVITRPTKVEDSPAAEVVPEPNTTKTVVVPESLASEAEATVIELATLSESGMPTAEVIENHSENHLENQQPIAEFAVKETIAETIDEPATNLDTASTLTEPVAVSNAATTRLVIEHTVDVQQKIEATADTASSTAGTNDELLDLDESSFDRLMNSMEKSDIEFSAHQKTAVRVWIRIRAGRTGGMKRDLASMYRSGSYRHELWKLRERYSDKFDKWLEKLDPDLRAYFQSHWPGPQ